MKSVLPNSTIDNDPIETKEWLDSIQSVVQTNGIDRANFLISSILREIKDPTPISGWLTTPYKNTIPAEDEAICPGDMELESRIRALIRWNAAVMVVRAVRAYPDLGGHIGTFASSATLYDVGFNHFWRGGELSDLIYMQGHASPGIYARSFLEGNLSEQHLENFRREVTQPGLSSYPHPWLMPDYWQFPTVSMGLGPLQAIYQARYMRYLEARKLIPDTGRKVWCFCGDGEMDEPESLGALSVAGREKLDNLIFVINCNLQRLDGPVRGNGKIIQELESVFKGAGWNVIKLIWGDSWDPLLADDVTGELLARMQQAVDGEYQNYKAKGGTYTREHFFGANSKLQAMVEHLTDTEITHLKRGGHDPQKVYAAYHSAVNFNGQPTVILAKTVKGYGLGSAGEGLNTSHNVKKMATEQLKAFRDRFNIPIKDSEIEDAPYYRPAEDSPEIKYIHQRRKQLGGFLPKRRQHASDKLQLNQGILSSQYEGSTREISTTMAFVRMLSLMCKDKKIGKHIVPIVPDESRTFGMEGLFRQLGIYSPSGQLYKPVDSDQVMFYKEAKDGQILQEGINEPGAFCSWIAAATAYSNHNVVTIPFYIYYSMFGFQRVGDLAWAAGDSRARGFLIGGTSGRTTLNGEGLQHEDGHSHVLASTIPNCISYDPTFNYELAVIIEHGLQRLLVEDKDEFYYITVMNENYQHPAMPKGAEQGIIKGLYKLSSANDLQHEVHLLGSGTILNEVLAAQKILQEEFSIATNVWSAPSFNNLAREGRSISRWNRLNPDKPKQAYVTQCLGESSGPIVAATDYMKQYAEQIREFIPGSYTVLGTDGFGRSDSRLKLRRHFEVDRQHIVVAALSALCSQGKFDVKKLKQVIKSYEIDSYSPDPQYL